MPSDTTQDSSIPVHQAHPDSDEDFEEGTPSGEDTPGAVGDVLGGDGRGQRLTSPHNGTREREGEAAPPSVSEEATAEGQGAVPTDVETLAASLARRYEASRRPGTEPSPVERVRDRAELLDRAYERFRQRSETEHILSSAAEWLLDNYYLVQQALRLIREDMPRNFYQELPKLEGTWLRDYPRVYAMMRQVLRHLNALVAMDWVAQFISAYQTHASLTMGELWAIPTMLRTALLELLIEVLAKATDLSLEDIGPEAAAPGRAPPGGGAIRLTDDLSEDVVVAHCVRSLRILANHDWQAFFEEVSRVEAVLSEDPAGVYTQMEFNSRDRYRKAVEQLALGSQRSEVEVAETSVRLGQRAAEGTGVDGGEPAVFCHVGHYLVGRGRAELEGELGYRPQGGDRIRGWIYDHAMVFYLGGVALLTLLTAALLLGYASRAAAATNGLSWWWVPLALFFLLPGSVVAVNVVNAVLTRILPPQLLPKLELEAGIPDEMCTVVVIPALLTAPEEVDILTLQLEQHFLSNTQGVTQHNLRFALLTDFADALEEHMPEDEALLARAQERIEALNRTHRQEGVRPFYLLHRCRQWNPKQGVWMGWERKRGKLHEFNQLLLGETGTSYTTQIGDMPALRGEGDASAPRYVITLDADTVLPLESAGRLVGTLAHPLNRAQFDAKTGRVVSGYTVLQPRTEVQPISANATPFARVFSGSAGLDLYTLAVSDVYQDLFGEGIYVGKGIYDIHAFERSLAGQAPENTLLSHDLFEGLHGRVGLVTDIILYEDFPPSYPAHALREHRWVRGDWQLLPWLVGRAPKPQVEASAAEARPRPEGDRLLLLDRWKIFDNLRRSLREPALVLLFVLGWLVLPGSPWIWTLLTLLISAMPVVTGLLRALVGRDIVSGLGQTLRNLRIEVVRWLIYLAVMVDQAVLNLDAIVVTLVRLLVTRKRLLQWTTAAHTLRDQKGKGRRQQVWLSMVWSPLFALILASVLVVRAATGVSGTAVAPVQGLAAALPLLLIWFIAPELVLKLSTPTPREVTPLSSEQRNALRRLARRTWFYFERYVGPDDHWLPPDHYQEDPRGVVAHRTSPTNIGLMLLSTLSAYDLGYAGPLTLTLRLRSAFDGMERMERYRGHFLNWYETRDLNALPPRYVSTVDSGNLAAMLMVLRQGLLRLSDDPVLRPQRWEGLRDVLGVLTEILETVRARVAEVDASPGDDGGARELREAVDALDTHLGDVRRQVRAVLYSPERVALEEPEHAAGMLADLSDEAVAILHDRLGRLLDAGTDRLEVDTLHGLRLWSERLHYHLRNMREEIGVLASWVMPSHAPPSLLTEAGPDSEMGRAWQAFQESRPLTVSLAEVPEACHTANDRLDALLALLPAPPPGVAEEAAGAEAAQDEAARARRWCREMQDAFRETRQAIQSMLIGIRDLANHAGDLADQMDFGFLMDRQRQVFHLGYIVDAGELDSNHYDLLASEARTASLVAIAKGEVPQSHWLHLARPIIELEGIRALLSWSGSMFEFLMPDLFTRSYDETLLAQTSHAVVARQIAYAREQGVPWGISESGYYRFDAAMNYQYRAFGVPGTGRKRGLGEDLVITPYASLIALRVAPQAVFDNMGELTELGMLGNYGFYEAADFTRSRLSLGRDYAIVRSYMVHHQGMIMMALANALCDDVHIERFHADPRIQTVSLLLQERLPAQSDVEDAPAETISAQVQTEERVVLIPWEAPANAPLPWVHYLSNGDYGVMTTGSGGGYSRWRDWTLTRWRADTTRDAWGTWIYVQDLDAGELWSLTEQPRVALGSWGRTQYYPHQVQYNRRVGELVFRMEVAVAPDDPVELRRLVITNHADTPRHLQLTSYAEVVLGDQATDLRHPAFNRMFIESEAIAEGDGTSTLIFRRRLRAATETPVFAGHALVLPEEIEPTGQVETDRARFLGRGRTPRAPEALMMRDPAHALSGTTGTPLDPIMAIGQAVTLNPHTTVTLAYLTAAGTSRGDVRNALDRYRSLPRIDQAFDSARLQSEMELRDLNADSATVSRIQHLLSALLYPFPALRAPQEVLTSNRLGQPGLWSHAISGDYPILLLRISRLAHMSLVGEAIQAHRYWRHRNIKIDLVLFNERDVGYEQQLNDQLRQVLQRTGSDTWLNARGGIFLINANQLDESTRTLILTAARVVLTGGAGALGEQLSVLYRHPTSLPSFSPPQPTRPPAPSLPPVKRPEGLQFDNGYGGFSKDGWAYEIFVEGKKAEASRREERGVAGEYGLGSQSSGPHSRIPDPGSLPPAPWINVIANEDFGFFVSESGGGYTWAVNSGENRLTPWRNDPVSDTPGEVLYVRDEETGEVWSPTPLPIGADAPTLIRHEPGMTTFTRHSHGLRQVLRLFVPTDAPVKVIRLRLENASESPRRVTLTYYAAWVLGPDRQPMQQYVVPAYDDSTGALLAHNTYNTEFGDRVAFLASDRRPHGVTADRTEFLGRGRGPWQPAALDRVGLSSNVSAGLDPCAALQVHVDLAAGEVTDVVFLLGQGETREASLALIRRFQDLEEVEAAQEAVAAFWHGMLETIVVETPDAAMNTVLPWVLYQALSCRVWGRSALYQSSGAFGFRDQLQDVMSLLHARPDLTRAHILRAARHQFEAGDVLHWWHPPSGRGVRTRISDDLLWLPYVTAEYVTTTGDAAILDEQLSFLSGEPLQPDEEERYGHYDVTASTATLYEHCLRALDRGTTSGPRGLPLIGAGDWNDGMNRVGIEGHGESVWLGWFLYAALTRFVELAELREGAERAASLRAKAQSLRQALGSETWDGAWYRRAYYDDGTPLGSSQSAECQIDAIAQSWAVLSGAGEAPRIAEAMASVNERLVRDDDGLLLLFTPPFDETPQDPGYIKGYPPGVRENGGQYTHAAIWTVWAFVELGQGDRAMELFSMLNPINHSRTREKADRYRVEPYVVAADVYGVPPYVGHGGWTWYTGSSGWLYRLGIEAILGIHREGDALRIDPVIPAAWQAYAFTYRYGESSLRVEVENPDGVQRGVTGVWLDGASLDGSVIPLRDDGEAHTARVRMGARAGEDA